LLELLDWYEPVTRAIVKSTAALTELSDDGQFLRLMSSFTALLELDEGKDVHERRLVGIQAAVERVELGVHPVGLRVDRRRPGVALALDLLGIAVCLGQQHLALAVRIGTDLLALGRADRPLLVGDALALGLHAAVHRLADLRDEVDALQPDVDDLDAEVLGGFLHGDANFLHRLLALARRDLVDRAAVDRVVQRVAHERRDALLGGALARSEIYARLDAPGVDCALNGLFLADGAQHVDCQTTIDHASTHGTSRELYKGILGGRSRGVFNGSVLVRPDAQKTNAQQFNPNLLISDGALINTKPTLEISADDVKCSHGATTGRLDPAALFYLRSRGLNASEARAALTRAFAGAVLSRMDHEPFATIVHDLLDGRLARLVEVTG